MSKIIDADKEQDEKIEYAVKMELRRRMGERRHQSEIIEA